MAAIDEKISDLTSLTEAASNDLIPLVDVSEDKTTNIRKDRLFGSPGQIGWDNSNTGKFTTILLDSGATVNEISTDVLFSAASNIQLSTSLAVKTYVDTQVAILPEHNTLISIQGGDSTNIYHLTVEQHDGLTEGGITFLHTHSVGSFDHNTLGGLQGGDSVSEFYHFDLQTYSQITSDSTSVIFSGDIVADDLFLSGSTINVGTGQIKSTAGNIELYNAGVKTFETVSEGINILGSSGNLANIKFNTNVLEIKNTVTDGIIKIYMDDNTGNSELVANLDTDSGHDWYVKESLGIKMTQTGLWIMGGNQNLVTMISQTGANFLIDNDEPAGTVTLQGRTTGDAVTSLAVFDPDGSVDLYYDGDKKLETTSDGLKVTGTVNASDPVSSSDLVTLDFMSKLGTDRQRLTYDGTANLDISVEHIVDVKYVDFLDNEDAPPWQEGRVFWDKGNNTFGVYNDVPDVTLQVGQETHIKIRNESGLLIPNGSICYVVGASQGRALVLLASATSELTSEGIVVVTHDLDNNTDGYGTIVGMVRDIGTGGIVEGDQLYLSATVEGGFTSVRPSAPNYVVDLGTVITTDGTMGDILVQILNHGDFATLADVSLVDSPNNGETLVYDGANDFWISESQPKVVSYTLPLSGVTDVQVPLTGSFIVKDTGQTADVTDDFAVSNQHLWVLTNSVTLADSTGTITITGTSLSESTAVPVIGDTEVITIDSTAETYYQSIKKWWDITNIDISADIPVIDFDYGIIGYPDFGNRNFKILGYRMDAFSSGVSPDMRLIITKVHDLGDNKVEFIELEDIGVDSGAIGDQIIDHVRSGVDDRSYNPPVTDIWANDETLTFKQLDFDEYWTNDENHINAAIAQEGIFIRIEGEPPGGGITNVDFVNLVIFFAII
jgi:hypothetical protein